MTISAERSVTFLPEPEPRPVENLIISVDDHLIEPADMFTPRVPARFGDDIPEIVTVDGAEAWRFEDQILHNMGLNAVAGRPPEEWNDEPTNFSELRRGCFDIEARIKDMDINGVYASVCFPSRIAGFGGARFAEAKDQELGKACVRAWNDWYHDEWMSPYPDRIIGLQLTHLTDPEEGAREIRRNAERGFHALSFPEVPGKVGLPTLRSGHWDPIFRACEETGTVVCLHTGSSGQLKDIESDTPRDALVSLFPAYALLSAMNWLWSMVPSRFPNLKIALAEGGIGWVPMIIDRLRYMDSHAGQAQTFQAWTDKEHSPTEVLLRNFFFCAFDDPAALLVRDRIGVDNIMVEVDYPHADGSWPNTQPFYAELLKDVPKEERDKICWSNAAKLFDHPVPEDVADGTRDFRTTLGR
ncbi:amidohydrolase family protein [Actinomadura sp. LD22]|uniref:Amidohydrolase family protein n=1 Tax=Actinomadura physcomitrii TaxID=2650748 RepID=A0A6I4M2A9_9ACTN|nr:amidohydrolase family protein [Actinomadura physcomitrii]MVZ99902.1 amidohydrolase family protein [Actinomadura physcomitrii]